MKTMIALQVGVMGLALGASRLAQATEGVGSNPTSGTFAVIPSFVARAAPDLMGGVTTTAGWAARRTTLVNLLRDNQYGRWNNSYLNGGGVTGRPSVAPTTTGSDTSISLCGGTVTKRKFTITYTNPSIRKSVSIRGVKYVQGTNKPAFLLINHRDEANISLDTYVSNQFFPICAILKAGYAAVAFMAGDLDKDTTFIDTDGTAITWTDGVHGAFPETRGNNSWGTLAAWAWGASRVLDYLVNDPSIDDTRVAVIGHSRGGKTSLWATALDTRFKMAVSNDAGTGGHAMSRGNDGLYTNKPAPGCTSPTNNGQTHAELNSMFPSWFSTKYRTTAVGSLPVDAHMLIAATAPRPVYVGTAKCDDSDDTEGNVAALIGAARGTYNPWSIHGKTGFVLTVIPSGGANSYWNTTNGFVGYHRRNGTHELLLEDWNHYIAFANARLKYPN